MQELAKLVACCDLKAELAERNQKFFGADRCYTDLDEMLAKEELDAAMVVGPPTMHVECGRRCLEAGLHTMMEKPMASTVDDARELVELAEGQNLITQIGHNMRHGYMVQKVKQIMQQPEFGRLMYVESRYHMPSPGWTRSVIENWTTEDSPEGWMYMITQGVHPIDLARHIGGEIATVQATISERGKDDKFAMVVSVTYANGACGAITMTGSSPTWSTRLEVVGDGPATMRLTDMSHLVYEPADEEAGYRPPHGVPGRTWTVPVRDNSEKRAGYEGQMVAFCRAVQEGQPSFPTFRDAYQAMRVAAAIVESLETGATVEVPTD